MDKLSKFGILLNKQDSFGNQLLYNEQNHIIQLLEAGNSKRKTIGVLQEKDGEITFYKKEKEQYIHRNTQSWTIPRVVAKEIDTVEYETDTRLFSITKAEIFDKGFVINNDPDTVDRKIYVPLIAWTQEHKDAGQNRRAHLLGNSWYQVIGDLLATEYMDQVNKHITELYHSPFSSVFPAPEYLFNAFKQTTIEDLKIVLVGNAPYAMEEYQGLAYSVDVSDKILPQPTQILLDAVETDIYDSFQLLKDPNLQRWATQGVLLLNSVLTTEPGKPHYDIGWERFIHNVLKRISERKKNIAYLLLGNGQQFINSVDHYSNLVLSGPSPEEPGFMEKRFFSTISKYLLSNKKLVFEW